MVLVGHCTLKDCDVAGIAATNMNTDRYRSVPAFLLDIRTNMNTDRYRSVPAFLLDIRFSSLAHNDSTILRNSPSRDERKDQPTDVGADCSSAKRSNICA
jgi:hypothetical protein